MTPEQYMRVALAMARKGAGHVNPNPMVGAVVVKDSVEIARGWHHRFGEAHAEPDALNQLTVEETRGADLYVNLEPCSFFGKTPPCTERIIEAGIARVYIGMTDPNPRVSGRGVARLRAAGIDVLEGVLASECQKLNESFITAMMQNRSFVTLKLAMTLDGKIALPNGKSQWITGTASRTDVHAFRSTQDAVVTGIGTVLADDCRLDVRHVQGPSPWRIVLDPYLDIPLHAKIIQHAETVPTVVVTGEGVKPSEKLTQLKSLGVQHWMLNETEGRIDLEPLLKKLYDHDLHAVMVEAGRGVATSFLKSGRVDKIRAYVAPKIFGQGLSPIGDLGLTDPADAFCMKETIMSPIGDDFLIEGRLTCLPD